MSSALPSPAYHATKPGGGALQDCAETFCDNAALANKSAAPSARQKRRGNFITTTPMLRTAAYQAKSTRRPVYRYSRLTCTVRTNSERVFKGKLDAAAWGHRTGCLSEARCFEETDRDTKISSVRDVKDVGPQ